MGGFFFALAAAGAAYIAHSIATDGYVEGQRFDKHGNLIVADATAVRFDRELEFA